MSNMSLHNIKAVITAGPTREYLDPIRYLTNVSSGKQGYAIAAALQRYGAQVKLISGPVALAEIPGVQMVHIETAQQMYDELASSLPADLVICNAAVADFRPAHTHLQKIKKQAGVDEYQLELVKNLDLLKYVSSLQKGRPNLVIGFAAETENLLANAQKKLANKQCDWILANDISAQNQVIGYDHNQIIFMNEDQIEHWPRMTKASIAEHLLAKIINYFHSVSK